MVCVPCIILPVLMFIYMKFIAPFIYRILPERWVHILDPYLYPTCSVKLPTADETDDAIDDKLNEKNESCCSASAGESKKDQ